MDNTSYSTRDLTEAATLVTYGHPIINIDYQLEGEQNRPIGYFHFDACKEVEATKDLFMKGKCLVEPRMFQSNTRMLKSKVTNIYKNPRLA